MELTLREIAYACSGKLAKEEPGTKISGISTDSRTLVEGEFFIPIKGEHFDGHDYISTAYKKGAVGAITQNPEHLNKFNKNIILVEDTLEALNKIAYYYRKKFNIPFVAVTGSTGKTTTKDMITDVLSQKYKVLKNIGSYNNKIGLPLTIFKLDDSYQLGVVEMGMSGFGEIAHLAKIVEPEIAIITNIGLSHIEKLGSVENITKAKSEILECLKEGGTAFINADDSNLVKLKEKFSKTKFKTFGINNGDIKAFNIKTCNHRLITFNTKFNDAIYEFEIRIPGLHNVYNALAAISVGLEFNLTPNQIKTGLKKFKSPKMRLEIVNGIKDCIIINDTYNASPDSMKAAIDVLHEIKAQKKGRAIAVLGDMLEMGDWGADAHKELGIYAAQKGIDVLITVGELAKHIATAAEEYGINTGCIFAFNSNFDAVNKIDEICKNNDVILVKGSRGMKMEEIVHSLTNGR
ncbi:MAG TPA: UDP-N-acetylmuramoyl-tripeptide--D-alanyl-D-alanine ligase [Thermoanaerobacterales bacterium]|nr:UDP-N-acetylmuramoyl-tripeptide--D-alanyl-D-alanine ligase [Thermoanaerobacterales bacterium]